MRFEYWKNMDKIQIVYSTKDTITFNGETYPKAYIVEVGNEKQLKSAIDWASFYKSDTGPTIIETTNDDFEIQIASAASNSYSQGGKLSFWMCIITKPKIASFAVGINSNLLATLILGSTIINGKCNNKVLFARQAGQLGVLHKNMPEYINLLNDSKSRENKNKGKTKNWKVGYEYVTLTQSDTFIGKFDDIVNMTYSNNFLIRNSIETFEFSFDFNKAKKSIYVTTTNYEKNENKSFDDFIKNALTGYYIEIAKNTCPARQQGKQIFVEDENLNDNIFKSLYNVIDEYNSTYYLRSIPTSVFSIFTRNPEYTIRILELIRNKIAEDISAIKSTKVPKHFGNFNGDEDMTLECNTCKSVVKYIIAKVIYNNETKIFNNYLDLYDYFIEIAKANS